MPLVIIPNTASLYCLTQDLGYEVPRLVLCSPEGTGSDLRKPTFVDLGRVAWPFQRSCCGSEFKNRLENPSRRWRSLHISENCCTV